MQTSSKSKNVALVLSSGGARGLAHIGVIDELQARGYNITSIAGSSMGALVGGLLAAGKIDEFRNWVITLNKKDVLSLIDFTITTKGFVKGDKVFERMRKLNLIPDINIEDLPIPYAAVAVDILNNKECVFQSGSLLKAIRASISIPSVFTPVSLDNGLLVDGGVLNPLPLKLVKRNPSDLLVAVDLNALNVYEKPKLPKKKVSTESQNERFAALINKWDELFGHNNPKSTKEKKVTPKSIGYFDVLMRSVLLMQSKLTTYATEITPPDVLVPISKDSSTVFEFYKAEELIAYGKEMCAKALEEKGL
ncbi:MAG TPA: patatin-like phospholipase family protein [Tenuifilaceae bacterium]|nr:patatin-like phospholipase family protein [Tenuifilaceae bacterium]